MMKKVLSLITALVLLVGCTSALAASTWKCPVCGHSGNTGNFCPECGSAMPDETWTCANCGQSGNTGRFCINCGQDRDSVPETAEEPADLPTATTSVQIGDSIFFGRYEQDGKTGNGTESIEWIVLDIWNGNALVIARYGLVHAQFTPHSSGQTWYNCKLREILNSTFYNQAFNSSEKRAIQLTEVDESSVQWDPNALPAATRDTENTFDYIFILSYAEMAYYLPTSASRLCKPTKYAVAEGGNSGGGGYCWYWMRNPCYKNNAGAVSWEGALETCYMNHTYGIARPACWVDLAALGY